MNTENLGTHGATRQSWSRESIRVIYAELKAEHPKADHSRMVKLLAERLEEEDARKAAADYIVTACENAQVGYEKRDERRSGTHRRRTAQERQKEDEEVEAAAESIKDQIMFLNQEMPNGKRMRYCTGAEMDKFGKAYQRIAKRVGSTKMVGSVLNEKEVRALLR